MREVTVGIKPSLRFGRGYQRNYRLTLRYWRKTTLNFSKNYEKSSVKTGDGVIN